jgi:sec-independent protein translocase protein TatA
MTVEREASRPYAGPEHLVQVGRQEIVMVVGEIIGWELLLVIGVVVLLFGGSQIPKMARGLGSAKKEFEAGLRGESEPEKDDTEKK